MTDYSKATGEWQIDASHTTLAFSARHAMVTKVRGQFTDFSGSITLDGTSPENSAARATIKTASLNTNNADRDAHVQSADFLDVEKFPELTFVATAIKDKGDGAFTLAGDLTVKDVTRQVDIDVTFVGISQDPWGGTRVGFEAHTEISRKDFGLTWNVALETGGVLVSDKVRIDLDVEAVKQESTS